MQPPSALLYSFFGWNTGTPPDHDSLFIHIRNQFTHVKLQQMIVTRWREIHFTADCWPSFKIPVWRWTITRFINTYFKKAILLHSNMMSSVFFGCWQGWSARSIHGDNQSASRKSCTSEWSCPGFRVKRIGMRKVASLKCCTAYLSKVVYVPLKKTHEFTGHYDGT